MKRLRSGTLLREKRDGGMIVMLKEKTCELRRGRAQTWTIVCVRNPTNIPYDGCEMELTNRLLDVWWEVVS